MMETCAQHSIKHCLDMIAPFEASGRQEEKGQSEFYEFMVSIYRGMYENPEEYLVFPAPYEEYRKKLKQQETQIKKEKEHTGNSRESTLRNTFQQAIQFYALYFYKLGLMCRELDKAGFLVISAEDYSAVLEQMNSIHGARYNADRYELLSDLGIQTDTHGDLINVRHKGYRHAMTGLLYLCKAPDSKYKWMNFLRLDYKNAYLSGPTVDDICKTLPDGSRRAVKRIESNLSELKIKTKIKPLRGIVSDFKWKVEYSYKGSNICGFYADNEYLMLCIYFNHFQNINRFAALLQEEDGDLFQWFKNQFPERLCKCPSNRRVCFGEEVRRICGLSNRAEIVNPADEDVERALFILRKYRNIGGLPKDGK